MFFVCCLMFLFVFCMFAFYVVCMFFDGFWWFGVVFWSFFFGAQSSSLGTKTIQKKKRFSWFLPLGSSVG